MIECFCGKTFDNKYRYSSHSKTCELYQFFKQKYLSYTNLYYMYMVRRMLFKEIMQIYPYNMFGFYDFQKAQMSCGFPQFKITKSGRRLTPAEIDNILNYDYLYDCYINKKMSTYDISNQLNNDFDFSTILRKLTYFGINKRSASDANRTERHKIKQASDEVQSKVRKTNLERYGNEISSRCEMVKQKAIATSLKRYGTRYPMQSKIILSKSMHSRSDLNGTSKISNILFENLISIYPNLKNDFMYGDHERIIEDLDNFRCFRLDFSYDKNNVKFDIEFNGDYWHMNPCKYKETDLCENKTAKQIWKYDFDRQKCIEDRGYKVMVVWENDFIKDKEKVINECKKFIDTCISELK